MKLRQKILATRRSRVSNIKSLQKLKDQNQVAVDIEEWKPWEPASNPQREAIESIAKITGYAGSAGAGKSSLLLMLCNYYKIVQIFRKTSTNLENLIQDSYNMLQGSGASYNGQKHIWKNIPGNHILKFSHLQNDKAPLIYQGHASDVKAYDEATELSRFSVTYTMKWARSSVIGEHSRVFLTFNPPTTKEGLWVVDFFAPWIHPHYERNTGKPKAKSGEIRWFVIDTDKYNNEIDIEVDNDCIELYLTLPFDIKYPVDEYKKYSLNELELGGAAALAEPDRQEAIVNYYRNENVDIDKLELIPRSKKIILDNGVARKMMPGDDEKKGLEPLSRTFINAKLEDNPYLSDTDYEATLDSFPEPMRTMFRYGIFYVDLDSTDLFQVIPLAWVEAAMNRWRNYPVVNLETIGIDVSRGGTDDTIFALRAGSWIDKLIVIPGKNLTDKAGLIPGRIVAQKAVDLAPDLKTVFKVDVTGVGSSPVDFLRDMSRIVVPVANGDKAVDTKGKRLRSHRHSFVYANKVTYCYWNLRELLDPENHIMMMLPPDEQLKEELCAHRWSETGRYDGQNREITINSKDEVKKLIGRSPDRSDAVVLAFADELNPSDSFDFSQFL